MPSNREDRPLLLEKTPPELAQSDRKHRYRESLDTLILGSLSTSIGVVVLIVLFSGIAGRLVAGWNQEALTDRPKYVVPNKVCGVAAIAGETLGLAGILLARKRHGTISPLSILGTLISIGHIYIFLAHVALMELL